MWTGPQDHDHNNRTQVVLPPASPPPIPSPMVIPYSFDQMGLLISCLSQIVAAPATVLEEIVAPLEC